MSDQVLIVAAEASSSLYAKRLLEKWKSAGRSVRAFGIGSRDMETIGFECLGRSEEMAVVGLQEVVRHLPLIRNVYHSLLREADKRKPKFALLLDYPDFNLRLAKDLKKRGIKVIYYISPQVWAWRTGRVKQIKKVVDHMLVLFPFEKSFYDSHGVKADFVGHPALDELPEARSGRDLLLRRQKYGISEGDIVLGLMPGSRRSEIQHHLKVQLETAVKLVGMDARIRPVLMVAPTLDREFLRKEMGELSVSVQIIKESPLEMIELADVILVASGTATLMVGLVEKPMVIMYRMNALSARIAKWLVTKTPFFGMVNLIMGRKVVEELFQEKANANLMAKELIKLINDRSEYDRVVQDLRELKIRLGSKGATDRVKEILDPYFEMNRNG